MTDPDMNLVRSEEKRLARLKSLRRRVKFNRRLAGALLAMTTGTGAALYLGGSPWLWLLLAIIGLSWAAAFVDSENFLTDVLMGEDQDD